MSKENGGNNKRKAFRKQYNELIGQAIIDGLLDPDAMRGSTGPIASHAQNGNYTQTGGAYEQTNGGDHTQSDNYPYTQTGTA